MAVGTNYNAAPVQAPQSAGQRTQTAATPAQLASERADQALGQKVSSPTVATTNAPAKPTAPEGSNVLRDKMTNAGMKDVATPPSDANLRTWYSQHADHHDLIGKGDYKAAAAAYDKDMEAAYARGDQARGNELKNTKTQLEYAARMKAAAGENGRVSFPPTHDEAKAHFRGMKDNKDSGKVAQEFKDYTQAFYIHAHNDKETLDKLGKTDVKYTPHKNGNMDSTAPVGTADIRDNRGLNKNGQRVIDCEGYVELGKDLLGEAGFKQPAGGGVHRVSNSKNPAATGHVMIEMSRGKGERLIVDNSNVHNSDNGAYRRPGGTSLWAGMGMSQADMQVYRGSSLDQAATNQVNKQNRYNPEIPR